MTIEQVKEILTGKFELESDREYWVNKLAELERKAETIKNNERYFAAYEKNVPAFNR